MPRLKTILAFAAVIIVLAGVVLFFKWDIDVASEQKHKVAIQGYDSVSYFALKKPVMGTPENEFIWNEMVWRFSSRKNKDLFKDNPDYYAPQFGGNCAFTTSMGKEQMGLGKHWQIINDKLYLNSNLMSHYLWKWFPSLVGKAEVEWVRLISEKAAQKAKMLKENTETE